MPLDSFLKPLLANWPGIAFLVAIGVIAVYLRSPGFKGRIGEWQVNRALRSLPAANYHLFHDLYLPRPDGQGSTQIDHIVVSPFGIFVIETKNYQGWIFGGESQRQWTQQIYRHKNRFQNPLHQNHLHIRALMAFLNLPESAFKSLVYFIGDAQFKTPMPGNVMNRGLRSWIRDHQETLLAPELMNRVRETLSGHEFATDRKAAARQHLKDLKNRRAQ